MNSLLREKRTTAGVAIRRLGVLATITLLMAVFNCDLANYPPTIEINVQDPTPLTGSTQTLTATVEDLDEDVVLVTWSATAGRFSKTRGTEVEWTAPDSIPTVPYPVVVTAVADDRKVRGLDSTQTTLMVSNGAPIITKFYSSSLFVYWGNLITLTCSAYDPDGEDITYRFFEFGKPEGTFNHASPEANTATWEAPETPKTKSSALSREYKLIATVEDAHGYRSTDTLEILVFSEYGTIWIVDSDRGTVSKFTARGNKVLTSPHSFMKPVAVAFHSTHVPSYFVADYDAGEIVKLDVLGREVYTYTGIPNVVDIALHHDTGTLWAVSVSDDNRRLTVINTFTDSEIKKASGLRYPSSITISQEFGEVWIADIGDNNDRIIQLNIGQFLATLPDSLSPVNVAIHEGPLNSPVSLSVHDPGDATVYIADMNDNQIERLIYNGGYDFGSPVTLTGTRPLAVVAASKGLVWVLNSDGTIEYFDSDDQSPTPSLFSPAYYYFNDPRVIAADTETGEIWVADNGNHQVVQIVKVNPADYDTVTVKISGFSFVKDIVINK